jgi:hypothetical protein
MCAESVSTCHDSVETFGMVERFLRVVTRRDTFVTPAKGVPDKVRARGGRIAGRRLREAGDGRR